MIALVQNGTVAQVGYPRLWHDGVRWWDFRDRDPVAAGAPGWAVVTEVSRPADTATTTSDLAYQVVAGVPTQVWTVRPWTPEELSARAAEVVRTQMTADATADLNKLNQAIADLATLLGDETTPGSIKKIIGPTTAVAGTDSLRAIKAQTNAAITTAASINGLVKLLIDLAQATRDEAKATRRIGQQTLRLARSMVADYSTADVGAGIT